MIKGSCDSIQALALLRLGVVNSRHHSGVYVYTYMYICVYVFTLFSFNKLKFSSVLT